MTHQEYAETLRFFEGLGKPLSTYELEILAQDDKETVVVVGKMGNIFSKEGEDEL